MEPECGGRAQATASALRDVQCRAQVRWQGLALLTPGARLRELDENAGLVFWGLSHRWLRIKSPRCQPRTLSTQVCAGDG